MEEGNKVKRDRRKIFGKQNRSGTSPLICNTSYLFQSQKDLLQLRLPLPLPSKSKMRGMNKMSKKKNNNKDNSNDMRNVSLNNDIIDKIVCHWIRMSKMGNRIDNSNKGRLCNVVYGYCLHIFSFEIGNCRISTFVSNENGNDNNNELVAMNEHLKWNTILFGNKLFKNKDSYCMDFEINKLGLGFGIAFFGYNNNNNNNSKNDNNVEKCITSDIIFDKYNGFPDNIEDCCVVYDNGEFIDWSHSQTHAQMSNDKNENSKKRKKHSKHNNNNNINHAQSILMADFCDNNSDDSSSDENDFSKSISSILSDRLSPSMASTTSLSLIPVNSVTSLTSCDDNIVELSPIYNKGSIAQLQSYRKKSLLSSPSPKPQYKASSVSPVSAVSSLIKIDKSDNLNFEEKYDSIRIEYNGFDNKLNVFVNKEYLKMSNVNYDEIQIGFVMRGSKISVKNQKWMK